MHTQKITIHFLLCIFSHTKKLLCILTHKKLPYKKNVSVFSTHTKKYYVIHAKKLLVFFTIQKIAIHFFPYKKLLCILTHKKLPYKKNVSVFSTHTKKYYVIHAKKLLVFFTIQKIAIHFFPYKKLLCILTHKKLPYKKNVSVFSTHTKKYYVIHAKKLLVFFTIQKIAIHFFPYKKLLCSAHIQKITMYSHTQKITYKKKC